MMRAGIKEKLSRIFLMMGAILCLLLTGCASFYAGQGTRYFKKGLYDKAISDFNKFQEVAR